MEEVPGTGDRNREEGTRRRATTVRTFLRLPRPRLLVSGPSFLGSGEGRSLDGVVGSDGRSLKEFRFLLFVDGPSFVP